MEMALRRKQELQKQGKKGFTLVELIVVIVILGILAAIAVPALVGYIDKARTDGAITEAATARTALQVVLSDAYGHREMNTATPPVWIGWTYTNADNTVINLRTTGTLTGTPNVAGTISTTQANGLNDAVAKLTSATYTGLDGVIVDANFALTSFQVKVPNAGMFVKLNTDGSYQVSATVIP